MTLKIFYEAIELINNSDTCYNLDDAFKLLIDCKFIKQQDYDSNRWEIIVTDVYKVEDGYIGVRGVLELKSELIELLPDYCKGHCRVEEYEVIQTITYRPKTK